MRGGHDRRRARFWAARPIWLRRRAGTGQAQHPVHHGRRHRPDAAEHLSPRLDGRRNPEHRQHRPRGRHVHGLLGHAELHLGAHRVHHRHVPAARRPDPTATSGKPGLAAAGYADAVQAPARHRIQHRPVRQEPPWRPHRVTADGARLPGILGLSLSPRRDAAGKLPRHQQDADRPGDRAALQEHADPRLGGSSGCRRSRRPRPA